ncbi:MAG: sialate O-acetylesterase [Culturomica sp.]|jgi:sialate O-acetylesterase|nr:sialate O-acetylesterase [Culturomica sp.]
MRYLCTFSLLLLCHAMAWSRIVLPDLVGDRMVLQQNSRVKVWGEAVPGTIVTLATSWDGNCYSGQTSASGRWEIILQTPAGGYTPQTLHFGGDDSVTLRDVLIGEVWLAGGQSNMEMPLKGFANNPVKNGNYFIATAASRPFIRLFTVQRDTAYSPRSACAGKWEKSTPDNVRNWSAVASYYASTLQVALNVPVGIINASWGGSRIEAWMPAGDLYFYEDFSPADITRTDIQVQHRPSLLYNGMLSPCSPYTIRGFIWYQGCSNVDARMQYDDKMMTFVNRLRTIWNIGELPFYFVEIAPYEYSYGNSGALLRELQFKAQSLIPHSGMVCTNDLAEENEKHNIHPSDKQSVGERLAYWALNRTYGFEGVACQGPVYRSVEISGDKAILSFDHAEDGFWPWEQITGFEIAGADRIFLPAEAVVNRQRKTVTVHNAFVPAPVAVRYGFRNFLPGNLKNTAGLPVYPFRTDDFEE